MYYTYDFNGNQTTRTIGGSTSTFTCDAENRLTTVSGATSASFTYDDDGNRVKSVLNGTTTYCVGNHFEWTGSTTSMIKYDYADSQRIAMRKGSSTLHFLLGDHLGSTSLTANSSGARVAELRYKPWGESRYISGVTPTSYQFTGQRNDATGLYFYNARYYDPSLGRFLQADTIVPSPANPQTLNRYAYTRNNPIKYNDPTGHDVGCGGYDCGSREGQFSYALRHFPIANLNVVSMPTSTPTPTPTPVPTSDPTTTPNPQSNSQLILPINEPVYDNGYGFYPWNDDGSDFLHSGYDMHSASGDTTVVSMKAGTVVGVSQGENDDDYWGVRVEEENHIIRHYVHVAITEGIAVGKDVQAGTTIGNYGWYGDTTYSHLHFAIESPLLNPIDPAPYWPGGEPESWYGQWGSPRKPE